MRLITINETVQLTDIIESTRDQLIMLQKIENHDKQVEFEQKQREYTRCQREQEWKSAEMVLEAQRDASFNVRGNSVWDEVQGDLEIEFDKDIQKPKKIKEKSSSAYERKINREKQNNKKIEDYIAYRREADRRYDLYLEHTPPGESIDWCKVLDEVEDDFRKDGIDISKISKTLRKRARELM